MIPDKFKVQTHQVTITEPCDDHWWEAQVEVYKKFENVVADHEVIVTLYKMYPQKLFGLNLCRILGYRNFLVYGDVKTRKRKMCSKKNIHDTMEKILTDSILPKIE